MAMLTQVPSMTMTYGECYVRRVGCMGRGWGGGEVYPDMSEGGAEGFLTVAASGLGAEREEGGEDADEAVLEDTEPDDLDC